jgi:hypothetical protein
VNPLAAETDVDDVYDDIYDYDEILQEAISESDKVYVKIENDVKKITNDEENSSEEKNAELQKKMSELSKNMKILEDCLTQE